MLLALALIFLPIIFDGEGSYQTTISSRIPDPPEIAVMPEPVQSRPVILSDSDEPAQPELVTAQTQPDQEQSEALQEREPAAAAAPSENAENPSATLADASTEISESTPDFTRESQPFDGNGLPQGWSVRLGSFSDADNADALLTRLQAAGYRAYTRVIQAEQGNLTGVFVGPWLDRQITNGYQQSLQEEFLLAGIVVPYELER